MPRTRSWGNNPTTPDDPEFLAKVRAQLGPRFEPKLQREAAAHIPTRNELNVAGFYTVPDATAAELADSSDIGMHATAPVDLKADTVYGVGPKGAKPTTWSHEFRHRGGIHSEEANRVLDGLNAGSPRQWQEAVDYWRDWMARSTGRLPSQGEAEQALSDRLRREEWRNRENVGYDPTVLGLFTGDNERQAAVKFPYRHWAKPPKE